MKKTCLNKVKLLLLGLVFFFPSSTDAQFFKKLGKKISRSVERRIDRKIDRAVDKSLDTVQGGVEDAVKCMFNDNACINQAKAEGKSVVITDNNGNVIKQVPGGQGADASPTVNSNYDFKAGERTIFSTDFSGATIGNFPGNLEFISGVMAVVERNGKRFLRLKNRNNHFAINLPEKLPEKFTIQLLFLDPYWLDDANLYTTKKIEKGQSYFKIYDRHGVGVVTKDGPSSTGDPGNLTKKPLPIEIMVDGSYAKMYVNGRRVANIPNANIVRSNKLYFSIGAGTKPEDFAFLTDIRIAAGGQDLYQTLTSKGRVNIHNINFATGSAKILPSSSKALQKIGNLLQKHHTLKLLIQGHTDNTGSYENNMALSKDRAASVKTYLLEHFSIQNDRLKTIGLGATQPIAPNDTEEGRAKNRRVELVKLN